MLPHSQISVRNSNHHHHHLPSQLHVPVGTLLHFPSWGTAHTLTPKKQLEHTLRSLLKWTILFLSSISCGWEKKVLLGYFNNSRRGVCDLGCFPQLSFTLRIVPSAALKWRTWSQQWIFSPQVLTSSTSTQALMQNHFWSSSSYIKC